MNTIVPQCDILQHDILNIKFNILFHLPMPHLLLFLSYVRILVYMREREEKEKKKLLETAIQNGIIIEPTRANECEK